MNIRQFAAVAAATVALASPSARAQTDTYTFDPVHTSIGFKVRHMMVTNVRGHFEKFTGTIHIDPKNIEASSVEVSIETASVTTGNERRDGDLRSPNFFDAEKFPAITFKSKKVTKSGEGFIATGDLTMRGVTKEIQIPFTMTGPVNAGKRALVGVSGSTEINRQDFGVSWNNKLDAGGVAVSDMVTIELEVEANRPLQ